MNTSYLESECHIEIQDLLKQEECSKEIETMISLLASPDGIFNRVFALKNKPLSLHVSQQLSAKGYDMSDKTISDTWYYTIYHPGEFLAPHIDGNKREGEYRSIYTILVYLNMFPDFQGGSTNILSDSLTVIKQIVPRVGKGLLLAQDVLHEGSACLKGIKYVLRGDVMVRNLSSNDFHNQ